MAPATEVEEEDCGVDVVAIPTDPLAYSMQAEEARLLEWTASTGMPCLR